MSFRFPMQIGFIFVAVASCFAEDGIRNSVVKVHVTQRQPDFIRPWTKSRASQTSGSGVIIDGNRILTNAHVVLYASRVYVQGNQSSKREKAKVLAIAPEVDLALIAVDDESFFESRPALQLSNSLPKLKDTINVYGFPIGGEQMSITEGIISRIEYSRIAFTGSGLRIQIDAALNPGNSGGPAVVDEKVVGLAFSGIRTADNIGFVIGAEEIDRFLANIPDGQYQPKPDFFDSVQTTENDALREFLKLQPEQGGLFVTAPFSDADDYPLRLHDVITKIGEYDIDRKGYVQIEDDLKLSFRYLIPRLSKDGRCPATIVRDGGSSEIQLEVRTERKLVIPILKGDYPSYFVFGPILFTTPSQEFIKAISVATSSLADLESPLVSRRQDTQSFDGEELVMLGARLFPHATSEGYVHTGFAIVNEINGVAIKNLSHAAETLQAIDGEFLEFDILGSRTKRLLFKRQEIVDATEEVLEDEGIRLPYSKDLAEHFDE